MRFTIKTLLMVTTIVAIILGSYLLVLGVLDWDAWFYALYMLTFLWFWVPPLFLAFAVGRRKLTPRMVVGFAVCQAAAIFIVPLFLSWLDSGAYTATPPPAPAPMSSPPATQPVVPDASPQSTGEK